MQYTVDAGMFEGLFVRALAVAPTSAFAEELRRVGYDLERRDARLDVLVWVDAVDVAARHVYPGLPRDEAWVRLGRRFIEGYFQTLVGAGIAAVLPLMTARRFVERVPSFLRTGLGGSTADVELTAERAAVLTLHGPHERSAYLMAGVLEGCFERLGVTGTFRPSVVEGVTTRLELAWVERAG